MKRLTGYNELLFHTEGFEDFSESEQGNGSIRIEDDEGTLVGIVEADGGEQGPDGVPSYRPPAATGLLRAPHPRRRPIPRGRGAGRGAEPDPAVLPRVLFPDLRHRRLRAPQVVEVDDDDPLRRQRAHLHRPNPAEGLHPRPHLRLPHVPGHHAQRHRPRRGGHLHLLRLLEVEHRDRHYRRMRRWRRRSVGVVNLRVSKGELARRCRRRVELRRRRI
ncbi:hypothetical protein BHM03_00055978 [Ensete ventricosum]|nr:hypothetical protein BHM03_00055978 [Ensete ventricosum]